MANLKELQKKRKDILLNMNPEEVTVLFNEINKKAIESIESVDNGFKWNIKEINKANAELQELEKILSEKYTNIKGLSSASRLNLLLDKYIENIDETKALIFKIHFERLLSYVKGLETNVAYLKNVLTKFYFRYKFRTWNLETLLLEELNVPENIYYDSLEDFVYNNNAFYSKSLEKDFNSFIEDIVVNIESDITKIKPYLDVEIEPSEFIEEPVIKIVEGILQLKILATSLIKQYDEIKLNPFEFGITILAEVTTENYNKLLKTAEHDFKEKTVEEEKEYLVKVAPSYNFKTFELILPDVDVDKEILDYVKRRV